MRNQGKLIKKFFEREGKKTLIILDACRYDSFKKIYPEYLEGELEKVFNGNVAWTYSWFSKFCRDLNNVTLFTAAPVAVWKFKERMDGEYDPKDHFEEIPDWSSFDWDYDEGMSTPEKINEVVRGWDFDKALVRFLKPHPPFKGMSWTRGSGKIQRGMDKLLSGKITPEEIREAYEENVRVGIKGVVDLLPDLEGEVVVSADHGTCLYEEDEGCFQLFHASSYEKHSHLTDVPWFRVEGVED